MQKREGYNNKLLAVVKDFVDSAAKDYIKESQELLNQRQQKIQAIQGNLDKSSVK